MKTLHVSLRLLLLVLVVAGVACENSTVAENPPVKSAAPKKDAPIQTAEPKRKQLGKNVFIETQGEQRRIVVNATVCYRGTGLEGLLTIKGKKEHEYILAMQADARLIHAGLLALGAKVGSPVKYEPKFTPPRGSVVKIYLRYSKDGKLVTVPAQQWVRHAKTKKDLEYDWVFAGSHFVIDPDDAKKVYYAADDGDIVCTINMQGAMLDLPIDNPNSHPELGGRLFEANPDRVPEEKTWVEVIFEPVIGK